MSVQPRLEHRKFEAWVEVEGAELPCYAVDKNRANGKISCFIESQEGKNFSIHLKKYHYNYGCRASFYLDGNYVGSRILTRLEEDPVNKAYLTTSPTTRRPFLFSPIKTTDDDAALDEVLLAESAQNVYQITVQVHRAIYFELEEHTRKRSKERSTKEVLPEIRAVHESSEKAREKAHQIAYGEPQMKEPLGDGAAYHWNYQICELVGEFTFYYRPRHMLQYLQCFRAHQSQLALAAPEPLYDEDMATDEEPMAADEEPTAEQGDELNESFPSNPQLDVGGEPEMAQGDQLSETDIGNSKAEEADVDVKPEDNKDDIDLSSDDETVKALLVKALLTVFEKVKEDKRKKRASERRPKKRVKFEDEAASFFNPGEAHEIVDLTSD